jgi:colanic acid/amylovoran biosynthesis glycosyltransferase
MKTVAHFIRKLTQLRASFIQNQIINHSNYKPVVIFKYESDKDDGGFADYNTDGIPILNLWNGHNGISKLFYKYPKLITGRDVDKINKFLESHKVDILHFHYGTDAGVYYPFLKQTTLPSIVSFYGYDCSGFPKLMMGYGKRYLNKRVFPFVNRVLAMSPSMKNDLVQIGCDSEKIVTHYYGTDVQKFYMERDYPQRIPVNFLIISGLEPQKGHIFLLKAFRKAYEENKNIRLKIFGSGQLEDKTKNFIAENGMSSYVQMEGKVVYGSEDHLHAMRNADVFVHPSVTDTNGDKEGIPGAIVEAMASGLPVISTFHAGIPFIIDNEKTGMLVKEWDINALTQGILRVAANNPLREKLGRAAQNFALNNLNLIEKEIDLERIYDSIS